MADITLSNFESEVIEASRRQPVLLDIWAPWCGPCKTLGPMLEKLETAYAGRFVLAKLDADQQPEIAGQLSRMFGVRSIPLCVLFQDGQPVDGFVGALPESELRAFLDKHVPSADAAAGQDDAERAREMLAAGHVDDGIAALKHALELDPHERRRTLRLPARADPRRAARRGARGLRAGGRPRHDAGDRRPGRRRAMAGGL